MNAHYLYSKKRIEKKGQKYSTFIGSSKRENKNFTMLYNVRGFVVIG